MFLKKLAMRVVLMAPMDDAGMPGGAPASVETPPAAISAPSPSPAPAAPTSMLEAIGQGLGHTDEPAQQVAAAPAAQSGQPRDDLGRFTFKDAAGNAVDANGEKAPDQAAALAAQAAALPGGEEDPLLMPEGLGQKAQQRFQTLANTNKELASKVEHFETKIMPAVEAIQQTWQENQVQPEQFQQAMAVVGMMNRGDYAGAQKVLMEQLQQLTVLTGQRADIDPLAAHPDLRQQVQQLMMTEDAALEVARARHVSTAAQAAEQQRQQRQQIQQEQQQSSQQARQQVEQATTAVDAFCKQMATSDLDYGAIEAHLLPVIPEILRGVPPSGWLSVVKAQYNLIKKVAGGARQNSAPSPSAQPLRATGQAGAAAAPNNMLDAISQKMGWAG